MTASVCKADEGEEVKKVEKMIRAQILHYRQLAEDAREAGDEMANSMIASELNGFRAALELVLSRELVEKLFRPTEAGEE